MFFKKYKETFLVVFASLLLSIISVGHWFSNNSILYFVDSLVPLDARISFLRMFYNFDSHIFPWNSEASWSWSFYWLMMAVLREVFHSLSYAQFTVYIFLLASAIISFYLLAKYLWVQAFGTKTNTTLQALICFVFAIFYTFNLYTFYYAFFMFNPDAFIVAFLPLNLLSLFKIYPIGKEKSGNYTFWTIIFVLTLILMSSGFGTYIFLAQYLVWVFIYLIFFSIIRRKTLSLIDICSLVIFFFLILLSQWWWFFPALLGFKDLYDFQSSTGTLVWFISGFLPAELLNSTRLLGSPMMHSNPFSWSDYYVNNKFFTFPLFLIPALLLFFISTLKIIKQRSIFIYLLIMLLVSLFIVKFNNPPAAFILGWAFEYVPYFGAFREFYHKAGMYYTLPLLIICSIAAGRIVLGLIQKGNKFLLVIFALLIFINGAIITGPFFLFSYDNLRTDRFSYNNKKYSINIKTQIPPEYYDLKKTFEPECRGKAVMVIPRGAWVASANWFKYGTSYMATDLLSQTVDCSFITTLALKTKSEASNQAYYELLARGDYEDLKELMYKNQISYILLRFDNVPYHFSTWQYVDPRISEKYFDSDGDFEKKVINEYFTVYRFKKLDRLNTYGFALHSLATYTNSPLTHALDYIMISGKTESVVGKPVLNMDGTLFSYDPLINKYIASGICTYCEGAAEIERLTLGTKKQIHLILPVAKDGGYSCQAKILTPDSKVTSMTIQDMKGSKVQVYESQSVLLSEGQYVVDLTYTTQTIIDKPLIEVYPREVIEFHVGKIYDRSYRLSFKLAAGDQEAEVIFAKKRLRSSDILQKKVNPDDIVFTSPLGSSTSEQISDRIFQIDEFNVQDYFIYIRGATNSSKTPVAEIRDLLLERAIDTNYVTLACVLDIGDKDIDFTNLLKVSMITPLEYKIVLPDNFKKGFLTYNKTYADDWEAYSRKIDGQKQIFPHMQSGYGNAWYIENPKNSEITIRLARHDLIKKNGTITFIALPVTLLIYLILRRKK